MTENTVVTVNPLLERAHLPGGTYQLPSLGLFYKNGELDGSVKDGEVHIHPMTAYDEVLLRSPDLLLNGDAIVKVFKRCIPQILNPLDLFTKDVDFLLVCLRRVTYGQYFEVSYQHSCEGALTHTYKADIDLFINKAKKIDPTTLNKVFEKKLPNDQVVKMHPTRIKDLIDLLQMWSFDDKDGRMSSPEFHADAAIKTVLAVIESVDEIVDQEMIREWLATIPAHWLNTLADAIEEVSSWGPDFDFSVKCQDCKKKIDISAPVNPLHFFT